MRVYFLYCVASFVVPRVSLTGPEDAGSEEDVQSTEKWENFKALEAENPDLAWEKLKLWFKNNGNIQHVKQPWKDFRMFKDSLILEQLKSTEDQAEQETSEERIEEAWREFEKVGEVVEGLSEEEEVEVVLEKFREFYTQVKEEEGEESPGDDGGETGEGGEVKDRVDEGVEEEVGEDKAEDGDDAEGKEENQMNGESVEGNVETVEQSVDNEAGSEKNIDKAGNLPDNGSELDKDEAMETDNDEDQSFAEGELGGDDLKTEQTRDKDESEDGVETKEASELEQKAAVESELVSALSAEMRAKFEDLKGENNALKERILLLESGLSKKLDSLSSELQELKKQVEDEPASTVDTSTTNVKEVQDMISKSLKLYAADEVGMPDYALESSGAVVFTIGETEPYTRDTPWMGVFGISIWRSCKTPRLAIQKDNSPGNCWSFSGDKGSLTIQLSAQVFPEYFTIDHIPLELAPNGNASSAPNHFRVLGLDYGNAPKGHVLGNYEFTEFPIQTFAVQQNPYEKYFRFVKVEILSNHGNKDYTCLYRFRVHGRPHDTDSYNG